MRLEEASSLSKGTSLRVIEDVPCPVSIRRGEVYEMLDGAVPLRNPHNGKIIDVFLPIKLGSYGFKLLNHVFFELIPSRSAKA